MDDGTKISSGQRVIRKKAVLLLAVEYIYIDCCIITLIVLLVSFRARCLYIRWNRDVIGNGNMVSVKTRVPLNDSASLVSSHCVSIQKTAV